MYHLREYHYFDQSTLLITQANVECEREENAVLLYHRNSSTLGPCTPWKQHVKWWCPLTVNLHAITIHLCKFKMSWVSPPNSLKYHKLLTLHKLSMCGYRKQTAMVQLFDRKMQNNCSITLPSMQCFPLQHLLPCMFIVRIVDTYNVVHVRLVDISIFPPPAL